MVLTSFLFLRRNLEPRYWRPPRAWWWREKQSTLGIASIQDEEHTYWFSGCTDCEAGVASGSSLFANEELVVSSGGVSREGGVMGSVSDAFDLLSRDLDISFPIPEVLLKSWLRFNMWIEDSRVVDRG